MALPSVLKNFNLFVDALSYAGKVDEVTLPKLSRVMEDHRAGGMNASIDIDLGQEKLEMEFTVGGFTLDTYKQYAATTHDAVLLRFAGAYQSDDTGNVQAVEIVARGRYQEIDPGNAKGGEKTQTKIKLTMSYYKLTVDNVEAVEIDVPNFIEKIDGVDMLAEQRKAIGLG